MALLEVENLTIQFYTDDGVVRAVDGVSYEIEAGETVGLVGESGAGKSVASRALLGLLEDGEVVAGEVRFDGRNLLELSSARLREIRGNEIAIAFQDADAALNPAYTVGEQIAEAIRAHETVTDTAARERSIALLERVGIPEPASRYTDYPHQFSSGMCQRAIIAIALACDPDLLIVDEPTRGLDVTVQAQLLELLEDLSADGEMAIQLVSHDLGVVADQCERVLVIYAGKIVERGPVEDLFYEPKHPYTAGLLASIPRIGDGRDRLASIPGRMPTRVQRPTGCQFHPRCPYAEAVCARRDPELVDTATGTPVDDGEPDREGPTTHAAACHEHTGDLEEGLDYEVRIVDSTDDDGCGESASDPGDDSAAVDNPSHEGELR
ncbi:ABC transporter ATP-binding protein [Salinadaptatus halalkaliphilus]|uniref:ABC transporter ATP-binding protein n=1 Tax=Salinadaptatus halalkaliphilus TaxID=2419781 RepID=A0A4S3TMX1_9EURY|nr:ABC transporter ATP-binding protein [Salinadaptatus halalkaliphilus]THE64415.1 ABC transporter ATP-binding protein [Salinadaptatus halalkaliphilus]